MAIDPTPEAYDQDPASFVMMPAHADSSCPVEGGGGGDIESSLVAAKLPTRASDSYLLERGLRIAQFIFVFVFQLVPGSSTVVRFGEGVIRRGGRDAKYHDVVDQLFQDSPVLKFSGPFLSVAVAALAHIPPGATSLPPAAAAAVAALLTPTSITLLVCLGLGSIFIQMVGEMYKLILPELAVTAMLVSRATALAPFFIAFHKLLGNDPPAVAVLVFTWILTVGIPLGYTAYTA